MAIFNVKFKHINQIQIKKETFDFYFNKEENSKEESKDYGGIKVIIKDYRDREIKETTYLIYAEFLYNIDGHCVVDDDYIIVLTNFNLLKISLEHNCLVRTFDDFEYGSEIFKCDKKGGYILRDETAVLMLDSDLREVWRFDAPDVIGTSPKKDMFNVDSQRIEFVDFEGNEYSLDLDGNIISTTNPILKK